MRYENDQNPKSKMKKTKSLAIRQKSTDRSRSNFNKLKIRDQSNNENLDENNMHGSEINNNNILQRNTQNKTMTVGVLSEQERDNHELKKNQIASLEV